MQQMAMGKQAVDPGCGESAAAGEGGWVVSWIGIEFRPFGAAGCGAAGVWAARNRKPVCPVAAGGVGRLLGL